MGTEGGRGEGGRQEERRAEGDGRGGRESIMEGREREHHEVNTAPGRRKLATSPSRPTRTSYLPPKQIARMTSAYCRTCVRFACVSHMQVALCACHSRPSFPLHSTPPLPSRAVFP